MMSKIFQVRFTVGDKTVAHEHYTEKGAKNDAKLLSKSIGNSMMGEIDIAEDGSQTLSRVWEFTGGEMGKPIKKEGAPSAVEVLKTAEDTKVPEGTVEKKPKTPKLTEAEKLAKLREKAAETIKAIDEGTYVAPVRGRKPGAETTPRKPKVEADKLAALITALKCLPETAKILATINTNASSRRTKLAAIIIDNKAPILASQVAEKYNETTEDKIGIKEVAADVLGVNWFFYKGGQSWNITIKEWEKGDKRLNFVPIKVEVQDTSDEPVAPAPSPSPAPTSEHVENQSEPEQHEHAAAAE
jgi:hypothetical protein